MSTNFRATQPTQLLAATTTSAPYALLGQGSVLRIANTSGQRAYIEVGASNLIVAKAATDATRPNSGSIGLANGEVLYLAVNATTVTWIAVVLATGTGNVEVTVGQPG